MQGHFCAGTHHVTRSFAASRFNGRITRQVYSMQFAGEALVMATACEDGIVRVHDVESGASLYDLTDESSGDDAWGASSCSCPKVTVARFSKGVTLLAVAFGDGKVQLHEGETGEHVLTLTVEHEMPLSALAWSADGHLLAVAHSDGIIRIWDVSSAVIS